MGSVRPKTFKAQPAAAGHQGEVINFTVKNQVPERVKLVKKEEMGENKVQTFAPLHEGASYAIVPIMWGPDRGPSRRGNARGNDLIVEAVSKKDIAVQDDGIVINATPKKYSVPNAMAKSLGIVSSDDIVASNTAGEIFMIDVKKLHVSIKADEKNGFDAVEFDTIQLDGDFKTVTEVAKA